MKAKLLFQKKETWDRGRVLMDQHRGRLCHLHIGDKEIFVTVKFDNLDNAIAFFFLEVKKHFGELIL